MIEKFIDDGTPAKNILYVSFDNPIIKMVSVDDILRAYETLYLLEGEKYLFFDEVHYAESWELWTKVIYDTRPDIKLIATELSSPVLEKSASDNDTGRWNVLKVPTLSFYEYCELLELKSKPEIKTGMSLTEFTKLTKGELAEFMDRFAPLQQHFN